MASIHISSLHTVSKVTTGPLMSLHSTITKGVTVSLQPAGCCWDILLFPTRTGSWKVITKACLYLKATLSTVNNRPSISRAQDSSNPSANSSTPLNKDTVDSHRHMVRATHTKYNRTDTPTGCINKRNVKLCSRFWPGCCFPVFSVSTGPKPAVRLLPTLPGRPWNTNTEDLCIWAGISFVFHLASLIYSLSLAFLAWWIFGLQSHYAYISTRHYIPDFTMAVHLV